VGDFLRRNKGFYAIPTASALKVFLKLDMVAHACKSSYSESGDSRIMLQGQPRQKVSKTLSQKQAGMVIYICGPNYTVGIECRRIYVPNHLGKVRV
jgi:hypothetical protein